MNIDPLDQSILEDDDAPQAKRYVVARPATWRELTLRAVVLVVVVGFMLLLP